ncbi:hypothetical protein KP509_30G043100 [Ceratopteris richardii]|uniref:DNA topoisomerase (ATP-hydrolyzing) n=1 Tax=Ceratopteris richardii TaxID=49495 RepID=A0A8T2R2W4_CERRI|nr:hypothetical protein KP509_30G043100 [Ceratopteris richardii]
MNSLVCQLRVSSRKVPPPGYTAVMVRLDCHYSSCTHHFSIPSRILTRDCSASLCRSSLNRAQFLLHGKLRNPLQGTYQNVKRCTVSRRYVHGISSSIQGKQSGGEADGSVGLINGSAIESVGDITRPQDKRVELVELHKEVSDSYLSYAISVLVGRALPDARDGLKPVHRRILYAMHELGLSSRKPFKKSARVVGEVLGKFHPHGDTAVYDALVRMAQGFSLRSPLISGHGNFGSIDADPPAAMRYTECRLEALSESMLLTDLEFDTVDFIDNFDGSQKEPLVLPARLPNLLLNGVSGIAVGMATNIPPHNLGEVVDALCALIHNPNASMQELMNYLPGPDFPTGGQILGSLGVAEAYRTGKGKLIVRGQVEVEQVNGKSYKNHIVITEMPYQTNKAAFVQRVAELVEQKVLDGISDVRDESDRTGMRVVIEVKRGVNPDVILNNLYKHTPLQTSFNCNMVGIVNGKPELKGLKEYLEVFLDFRCSVIQRRTNYLLKQAEERDHIVQGILIGLNNLDKLVSIVKEAKDNNSASASLQQEFRLSAVQAEALLSMTLRRLTTLERGKFVEEHNRLTIEIAELTQLVSSRQRILQLIEKESLNLKKEFSTPRKTKLVDSSGVLDDLDMIPNEEALVILSERGYIKRLRPDMFAAQNRGTAGKAAGKLKANDALSKFFVCRNHDHLLFFSEKGTVYSTRAYQIPECSRTAVGSPLVQILPIAPGERITSVKAVSSFKESEFLVMLTSFGFIKRTPLPMFASMRSTGIIAIQLGVGDELKWVKQASEGDNIILGSKNGMILRVLCDDRVFRATSRAARGVKAMRLKDGDCVGTMDIVPADVLQQLEKLETTAPWLLFVTHNGYGMRVPLELFPASRLNRCGLQGCRFIKEDDKLAAVFIVGDAVSENEKQVVLGSHGGILNRLKLSQIPVRIRRRGKGVKLMRVEEGDKVTSVSLVSPLETEDKGENVLELEATSS